MSVQLENVTLLRDGRAILDRITATLPRGKVIGVVGPNGSGKSSLLRVVYGYLKADGGRVSIGEKKLEEWSPLELAAHLGVCPQEAEASLDFNVAQVLALRFNGDETATREGLGKLSFLKLEELFNRSLSRLSGGERQRVRLGLSLISDAPWLVLDEPANHLDLATAWSLFEYLSRPRPGGVILALHNLTTAARACHELLVLNDGKKMAQGPPREVLTRELLRRVFRLQAEMTFSEEIAQLRISGVG